MKKTRHGSLSLKFNHSRQSSHHSTHGIANDDSFEEKDVFQHQYPLTMPSSLPIHKTTSLPTLIENKCQILENNNNSLLTYTDNASLLSFKE